MGYLYKLDFASGKSYIGITTERALKSRIRGHRCEAKKQSQCAVHRAWRKYGPPEVSVLAIARPELLLNFEMRAIRAYRTFGLGGYNMTPCGDNTHSLAHACRPKLPRKVRIKKTPEEEFANRSAAHKGRKKSPEACAKMSAAHKGKRLSEEHKAKLSKYFAGRKIAPEVLARRFGRPRPEAVRAKIAAWHIGRKLSPETLAKLKGRIFTPEHCAHISAAKKKAA